MREFPNESVAELAKRYPAWFKDTDIYSYVVPGWLQIVTDLCAAIDRALGPEESAKFRVRQIKEKFGGLRFYCGPVTDAVRPLIAAAEDRADVTCEVCGEPGTLRRLLAWQSTLCDTHHFERLAKEGSP